MPFNSSQRTDQNDTRQVFCVKLATSEGHQLADDGALPVPGAFPTERMSGLLDKDCA